MACAIVIKPFVFCPRQRRRPRMIAILAANGGITWSRPVPPPPKDRSPTSL